MRYKQTYRATTLATIILLSSCSLLKNDSKLGSIEGTQVIYPAAPSPSFVVANTECLFSSSYEPNTGPESSALIGAVLVTIGEAVIPAATSFVFDRLIQRANQATLEKTSSSTAIGNSEDFETLYLIQKDQGSVLNTKCVLVARAPQSTLPSTYVEKFKEKLFWSETNRRALNKVLLGLNLQKDQIPELLMEFRIEQIAAFTEGGSPASPAGFRLRPTVVAYGATGAKKTSDDNRKDMVVALTMDGFLPEEKKGLTQHTVYSHAFIFEGLLIGTVEAYPDSEEDVGALSRTLAGKVGPIVAMPAATFRVGEEVRQLTVPLKMTAVITEVEEGGDLSRAMIAAVEKKKADIVEPIDTRLKEILSEVLQVDKQNEGTDDK